MTELFALLAASSLVTATYLTNPFSRFTIIRLPYRLKLRQQTHEIIDKNHKLTVHTSIFWRFFAWVQCGLYIVSTRWLYQPAAQSSSVESIIRDIHDLRFDPNKLLLISGDHFNGLFVRNLGVFYYPMLDSAIYSTDDDWRRRQEVYLQSVAFALGSFAKSPLLKTTIISTGRYSTTNINFYSFPSDSLYGILYALAVLLGQEKAGGELYLKSHRPVDTSAAARKLLREYTPLLETLYKQYTDTVFDPITQLIRTDIHLSGAKDITKRSSSFYDNVIYWKTLQLAMNLGIAKQDRRGLSTLKQRIIDTFWLEEKGYFQEDLSDEAHTQQFYSSDWLIVLSTGFLDSTKPAERRYYERSLAYIAQQEIARPFAIKYQNDTRAHRQFLAVRLAVASYGGNSIWSFWGMEFIKVNLLLYRETGNRFYLDEADYHIQKYRENIQRFRGFPEVYDEHGTMLQTLLYRSIRMTGWVIGFEQVLEMHQIVAPSNNR